MTTIIDVPAEVLSDYDDGFKTMRKLMKVRSAEMIVAYGDDAGPTLDALSSENTFYAGMADALAEIVVKTTEAVPSLSSAWLEGCTVLTSTIDGEKRYVVDRNRS